MLDMGFLPDIQRIIELLPKRRQNLMFSATFSDDIRRLSGTILRDPATVEVAPRNTAAERSTSSSTRSTAIGRKSCSPTSSAPTTCTRCWSSRGRSSRHRASPHGSTATASTPSRSTATARSPSGRARSRASRPARSGSSSRPTSRRVASTSRTCRSSSTSSCRGTRRTTSTASAGPAGRARSGEAISLVCIDEVDLLRGIQRMLKRAIPWTVEDGFVPDRSAEPRPLGMRAGHAHVGREHHARRKPVRHDPAPVSGRRRRRSPRRPRRVREALSAGRARPVRRAGLGDVGLDHLRAREEEPQHQVAATLSTP